MFFRLIIGCFLLCGPLLLAEPESQPILQEILLEARIGSYAVLQQGQTYTFLYVKNISSSEGIWLEEIHIPVSLFSRLSLSWRDWLLRGAPQHSGWNLLPISVQNLSCDRFYSFTQQAWIALPSNSNFLTTLLQLSFYEIPEPERKKIGPLPIRGKPDTRSLWAPVICWEGKKVQGVPFRAYVARWPQDQSDLAGRRIEIYLPEANSPYLTFFPYWMEVEGRLGQAKLRLVESGILNQG